MRCSTIITVVFLNQIMTRQVFSVISDKNWFVNGSQTCKTYTNQTNLATDAALHSDTYLNTTFYYMTNVGNPATIVNYSASCKVRLFFIACSWQQLDRPFVGNTYISFDVRIVSSKVYATYCWIRNGIQIKCILQEKYCCMQQFLLLFWGSVFRFLSDRTILKISSLGYITITYFYAFLNFP